MGSNKWFYPDADPTAGLAALCFLLLNSFRKHSAKGTSLQSILEEARKKEEVEAEWAEWLDLLAERQRRPLPAFDARAGDIASEIEINVAVLP